MIWAAPGRIQDMGYAPPGGVANADAASGAGREGVRGRLGRMATPDTWRPIPAGLVLRAGSTAAGADSTSYLQALGDADDDERESGEDRGAAAATTRPRKNERRPPWAEDGLRGRPNNALAGCWAQGLTIPAVDWAGRRVADAPVWWGCAAVVGFGPRSRRRSDLLTPRFLVSRPDLSVVLEHEARGDECATARGVVGCAA